MSHPRMRSPVQSPSDDLDCTWGSDGQRRSLSSNETWVCKDTKSGATADSSVGQCASIRGYLERGRFCGLALRMLYLTPS